LKEKVKDIIALSEALLYAVKLQNEYSDLLNQLEVFSKHDLECTLISNTQKKAFWINIYNAYFQILRKDHGLVKPDIYRKKSFVIAGIKLSLDDVEHGILRKYRYKYSLGFFQNIFASRTIKKLAVDQVDYRIHFALNCGAKSCPPIAFYTVDLLEQQLNMATINFLESETEFDDQNRVVYTTALFKWFLGDFGGMSGIRKIYKTQLGKNVDSYQIKFKEYSWEEELDNYVD